MESFNNYIFTILNSMHYAMNMLRERERSYGNQCEKCWDGGRPRWLILTKVDNARLNGGANSN